MKNYEGRSETLSLLKRARDQQFKVRIKLLSSGDTLVGYIDHLRAVPNKEREGPRDPQYRWMFDLKYTEPEDQKGRIHGGWASNIEWARPAKE